MAQTMFGACVAYKCDKFDNFPIPIFVLLVLLLFSFVVNILCRLCPIEACAQGSH